MIRTQIQLTEEQSYGLKKLAEKDNVSIAELIRRSVDRYLQAQPVISQDERERRLMSIVGIGSSGVDDLSVNHDRYLAEIYAEVGE